MLNCKEIFISGHALRRLFSRSITVDEVKAVVQAGDVIKEYVDDKPYPSFLLIGKVDGRIIHILVGENKKEEFCVLITAYEPDEKLWEDNFRKKK